MITTGILGAQKHSMPADVICSFRQELMSDALIELRAKTGINFVYRNELAEKIKVDGTVKRGTIAKDLNKLLASAGLEMKEFGANSIVIYPEKKKLEKSEEYIEAYVLKEPDQVKVDSVLTFQNAELASKMELDYPESAVKNKEHGDVNVKILVSSRGNVCAAELQESSGSSILDSVAIAYTNKMKFIPASVNGKPRSSWVRMIFKYFLTEK